jgi:HEAT repeat protein
MAAPQLATMNRLQRRARKPGEQRNSGAEIWRLVDLSKSKDPDDRLEAADNLCPCHVRRRIDEAWEALFRLLEDSDVKVRKAAFHTLQDGGDLSDPALDPILERASRNETDRKLD